MRKPGSEEYGVPVDKGQVGLDGLTGVEMAPYLSSGCSTILLEVRSSRKRKEKGNTAKEGVAGRMNGRRGEEEEEEEEWDDEDEDVQNMQYVSGRSTSRRGRRKSNGILVQGWNDKPVLDKDQEVVEQDDRRQAGKGQSLVARGHWTGGHWTGVWLTWDWKSSCQPASANLLGLC